MNMDMDFLHLFLFTPLGVIMVDHVTFVSFTITHSIIMSSLTVSINILRKEYVELARDNCPRSIKSSILRQTLKRIL